ncbi:hypothetical protein [Shewanella cyperi]|uniref:hypothetical protein n=1 Tax=Shewanella cyperi TaxID=2814292 RepID=UPI001A95317C|nr:hypothetical protein [Shewanella cyperi]QSX41575.1 hypothetical protein JYB84_03845 [Shewanella cyperi]
MAEFPLKQMPKRLLALSLLYAAAAVSGLIAKQGEIFCILTLLMVVAILARQRAGLWFLRGYTLVQLALVSLMPFILDQGSNVSTGPNSLNLGGMELKLSDYAIFAMLILLSMVQVWLAFTPKVAQWFKRTQSFNLMQ